MKKFILTLLAIIAGLLILLSLLAPSLLGFSVTQLGNAVRVSTGMGAKLACSGRYLSGFNHTRNLDDLASYSPAYRLLDLVYDDEVKRVTATLMGMAETSATYRPGLGCTLDIGDTSALNAVTTTPIADSSAAWPLGNTVTSIVPNQQQRLEEILQKDNRAGLNSRALLVVQDGKLVAEAYDEGISPETPLLGWSMGKSLTAMMIGRLQTINPQVDTSQPLFPQWNDDRRNISLENLLQMSSGLEFNETYAPGSDATKMLFRAHSASDIALQSPLTKVPGEYFSYSSGTTNLLSRWIYDRVGATPQTNVDFFYQQILSPLGMRHTTFEVDGSGVFVGSSYIYASARDWARLGLLMLQNGEWNGEQLLNPDWVTDTQKPNQSENDPRYGYQFWLNSGGNELRYPELPEDSYFMLGNREQIVMISPSTNTVIVRLGWSKKTYPTGRNFAQLLP
ncbi:serine hydrolase domain-containing protein [Microbulbifer agarilyticus]|uniref:serine hydrolase domain-containing protein n=1 Tax=Microbulbifer agarilyticus TaxID=260552 RepID=UPI001CD1C415|nr:serine hydrolase [Microbulbifer agarilyticus]MCA0893890.1 beta-lactamase family protein [Microbulbifer agarilyticus]